MSTKKNKEYHCPGLNCEIETFKTAAALARHANNSEECVEWNRDRTFMATNGCTDCSRCFKWFTTGGIAKHQKHCYENTAPSPTQQRDDSQSQTGQAPEPRGDIYMPTGRGSTSHERKVGGGRMPRHCKEIPLDQRRSGDI